jgi:hypothetical protein
LICEKETLAAGAPRKRVEKLKSLEFKEEPLADLLWIPIGAKKSGRRKRFLIARVRGDWRPR